jgi:hypothetical protein
MSVGVRVDTDDGIDGVCEHGHSGRPFIQVRSADGIGLEGTPGGISVTGHAPANADRLLIRPAGEPGRCRQPGRQVKRKARPQAARCVMSQPESPAPILTAAQAEPPAKPSQMGNKIVGDGALSVTLRNQH